MAPGCELGVWLNLRRCGLPMGLGNRLAGNSGQRGLPTFPQSARPTMEIWKTACWCYGWPCGLAVQGITALAAHADNGAVQGHKAVGVGRVGIIWSRVAKGGCGFWGCCGQGAVSGTDGMACDSLRVRIARDSGPGALAGGCDFVCSMLINGGKCPGFGFADNSGLLA